MISREEGIAIVRKYVKNDNLVNHMKAVEAAMRLYAEKMEQDVELWGLCGILHDFDWEIHPTAEQHPKDGAPILKEHGVSDEIIDIILSHADHSGVPRDSLVRKALAACDEITGLITAVALVRPSKSIMDVKVKSVKKKWKDKHFAAGANREEMDANIEAFGIEKGEHIGNVLAAMQGIAEELGLLGIQSK